MTLRGRAKSWLESEETDGVGEGKFRGTRMVVVRALNKNGKKDERHEIW